MLYIPESEQHLILKRCDRTVEVIYPKKTGNIKNILCQKFGFIEISTAHGEYNYLNMNLIKTFREKVFLEKIPEYTEGFTELMPVSGNKLVLDWGLFPLLSERFPAKKKEALII